MHSHQRIRMPSSIYMMLLGVLSLSYKKFLIVLWGGTRRSRGGPNVFFIYKFDKTRASAIDYVYPKKKFRIDFSLRGFFGIRCI